MRRPGRLEITTVIGCSMNCVYCPQKLLLSNYFMDNTKRKRKLELDDFKRCIDKLPMGTRVDFSGMAEPWLNDCCTDMVCYASEKGFPIAIYTTLVGMKKNDFDKIKEIPFEEFVLHIPDDQSNAQIDITSEYVDLLLEVSNYKRDGISIVTGYSCHGDIHPAIKNTIPEGSKLIADLISRAGNINSEYVENKNNIGEITCVACDDDMNHNVLLPDGTVLLCCMDYGMKHVLGNLLLDGYKEIQSSLESEKIRAGLSNESQDILCRQCTNARNIHEIFDEYKSTLNWCRGLVKNDQVKNADLIIYKQWVENYQKREDELREEIERISKQYEMRIKELADYKDWVEKFELLEKELRSELKKVNQQYEDCKV